MNDGYAHKMQHDVIDLSRGDAGGAERPLRVLDVHEFMAIELPEREDLLSPWMQTQSLSMIYAWRGVGKTHVALGISYAVASGDTFLGWTAPKPRQVLFIDGEMPAAALQERLAAIITSAEREAPPGTLRIVTPDLQGSCMPDLATSRGQAAINAVIEADTALIIVDNLSCLVRRNGRENEAESWLSLAEWALSLRAQGKSVLFIHHAGKNGDQRGTSKREDLLDTVICLRRPPLYRLQDGAVFEIHFEKSRQLCGTHVEPYEAQLSHDDQGRSVWTLRAIADSTSERVAKLTQEGLSQKEIADELHIHKSNVSRSLRKAEAQGLLKRRTHDRPNHPVARSTR